MSESTVGNGSRTLSAAERAERVRAYREAWPRMGVWALRCTANGKLLLGTSVNLPATRNQVSVRLKLGSYTNPAVEADLRQFGADAFAFEVIDELAPPTDDGRPRALVEADMHRELATLAAMWTAELRPWGERGYGRVPK